MLVYWRVPVYHIPNPKKDHLLQMEKVYSAGAFARDFQLPGEEIQALRLSLQICQSEGLTNKMFKNNHGKTPGNLLENNLTLHGGYP